MHYIKGQYNRDRKQISLKTQTRKGSQWLFSYKKSQKGQNPINSRGKITRCTICESVNHWAQSYSEKVNKTNPFFNWDSLHARLNRHYENRLNRHSVNFRLKAN